MSSSKCALQSYISVFQLPLTQFLQSHLLSRVVLPEHILQYLNSEIRFHVTSFVGHYLWPRKARVVHGGLLVRLDQRVSEDGGPGCDQRITKTL